MKEKTTESYEDQGLTDQLSDIEGMWWMNFDTKEEVKNG